MIFAYSIQFSAALLIVILTTHDPLFSKEVSLDQGINKVNKKDGMINHNRF
jgi:hypothetical protein